VDLGVQSAAGDFEEGTYCAEKGECVMDAKLKKLWLKALRSGKYRQGRSELISQPLFGEKGRTSYCCLGVLCKIQDPKNAFNWHGLAVSPNKLRDQAGLDKEDLDVLVDANDSYRWTFKRIADYIEGML